MKNIFESIAIFFVGLLSLSIVFFIVQYNLIEDDSLMDEIAYVPEKKATNKASATNYLSSLEGYGDDVDVEVDATQESVANRVVVRSEVEADDVGTAVTDKGKESYMQNLASYAEDSENKNLDSLKPTNDNAGQPITLDNVAVIDKSTMDMSKDIGSVVDDKEKSSYMENLDKYAKKAKVENLDAARPVNDLLDDPERLEHDEIVDEIGMALDAALEDL
jgi:hypothetical protein